MRFSEIRIFGTLSLSLEPESASLRSIEMACMSKRDPPYISKEVLMIDKTSIGSKQRIEQRKEILFMKLWSEQLHAHIMQGTFLVCVNKLESA